MSFFALAGSTMALLLALTAGVIFFLYWLKPPPQRVVVPSTFIWQRVLKERKRRSDFWRWLVSLLVALAVGLALAAALGRPEIEALSGKARRIAVVVDDSPTMGATTASGETRFDRALQIARELLTEGSASSEYLVTDTAGRLVGTEFGSRRTALERLEGLSVSLQEASAFPTADPILFSDPGTEIFFITDGVMVREAPSGVRLISVFEPVDNVGVTAFDLRPVPAEPNRFEAFFELTNHSAEPKRVVLRIDGASGQTMQRSVPLAAGQVLGETLDLESFSAGPVRVLIDAPGDGFELDNVAYTYLGSPRKARVMLVSSGNDTLETLLRLDPRVSLELAAPGEVATTPPPDLYVFDRFAPDQPPSAPALLIRPGAALWLPAQSGQEIENLSLSGTARDHSLMEHVALDDVVVEKAALVSRGAYQVVAGSDEEPLILVSETPSRFAVLTFALEDSNLPFQSSFPVFLSNAVSWLSGTEVVASSLGTVAVSVRSGVVRDIEGKDVPSRTSGARTSFSPEAPGLYSVKGSEGELMVSANLLSPRITAVNASSFQGFAGSEPGRLEARSTATRGRGELWVGLVLFALALLLLEWWTYHRRLTV
jgi:Aerotolerance regulator N-terminal